ncbi:tyrosine-type recombinase/integrase [Rhizobium mesoamericanum]|uniref:tyrosine-type recombinase/integrase n=1 Tax=Rhizobium mesoamericanum TaxID=1079800 RepID=UPI00040460A8|nr:tyrosine-type recombinase/integrase [Rhizobium mesoamericanum]
MNVYHDRHGKQRIYYREPGKPQQALPGPLFSEEFWTAYHKAKAAEPVSAGKPPAAGSMGAAIQGYYKSAEFAQLADSSKQVYRRILDAFAKVHGHAPIAGIQTKHINGLIDQKADTPAAANILRKRLSSVFEYAKSVGTIQVNPAKEAKRIKTKSKGYRSWTEADINAYRTKWKEGTPERIAMEVLLHTGLRRSDAVRLGWNHIVDDAFVISTRKSQEIVELHIPLHIDLAFIFDLPQGRETFISTIYGRARSEKSFTNWIRDAAKEAGLPSNSSPHGLRKAACRRLAESGCTALEIMSITGHRDIKEIERYTKAANLKLLSRTAMAKSEHSFHTKLPNPNDGLVESMS